VIGRAFRTGEPQLVPDVSRDPDYLEASPLVRAELAIPIRLHEGVLGVLNLESSDAADFSTESCRILCLLADQVAGAVLLTMMNRRLQQTTEQLAAANADQAKRAGGKHVSLQSR
jgi:GAF domain-containing protein